MKKYILLFFMLMCPLLFMHAQTYKYNTQSVAFKYYENERWSDWSDWEKTRMLVVLNFDRNVINIYSKEMQEYDIYDYNGESTDSEGGKTINLSCVNEDGLRCAIRLRIQSDGTKQLYVDFNDMMWVYNLVDR